MGTSRMKLHQIRYFVALCNELSFARAARRCGVSQPSLTNGVKALEMELGGKLFHRTFRRGARVSLTDLGKTVQPFFVRIEQEVESARKSARLVTNCSVSPAIPRRLQSARCTHRRP